MTSARSNCFTLVGSDDDDDDDCDNLGNGMGVGDND